MVYKVIGLMSGSSLDGLDIAYVQLDEVRGQWSYEIQHAECFPYNEEWERRLKSAESMHVSDFLKLHTSYGRYLGEKINEFSDKYELSHKVHFIASHGHTVFHEPEHFTTFQVGDGATIAAVTNLPVISDLRSLDVALGGQGAPIVPIGDKLLFGNYDYLLNIGGIVNMTVRQNDATIAFDICPANQVLNALAQREGRAMDENGDMASVGTLLPGMLEELNDKDYYKQQPPKSLSNSTAMGLVYPTLAESENDNYDLLHTATIHIAQQVAKAVSHYQHNKAEAQLLATGGGAFNTFLITELQKALLPYSIKVVVPAASIVKFKEALVMAFIGTLRWREEVNVLSSVTGAQRDSVGGALWMA